MAGRPVGNGYLLASPSSSSSSRPLGTHDVSMGTVSGGRQSRGTLSAGADLGPLWLQASPHATHDSDNDIFELPDSSDDDGSEAPSDSDSDSGSNGPPKTRGYSCCAEARYNCSILTTAIKEQAQDIKDSIRNAHVKRRVRKCFSVDKLKGVFPILTWGPKYRVMHLQGDLIAGCTVGLTLIPQAIAYSKIAEVSPEYGLYSSFMGCFIYVLFGTSKDIALGPTAIMSLITAAYAHELVKNDPTCAIILGLFTGIVQILMYLVGLGAVMNLISFPVMKAFTVACSVIIGMSQVKKWWGQKDVPSDFMPQLYWTLNKIPEARLYDYLLGCICLFFIVLLRKLKEMKWKKRKHVPVGIKIVKKTLWFTGTARNIIVLMVTTLVAKIFYVNGLVPFSLVGPIHPGIPEFKVPSFTLYHESSNVTYSFEEIIESIGGGIIVLPILGLVEAMSIAKVCGRKFGYKVDANQELLPYGLANILGSFVMGYPVSGSFSRTAVNAGSGVKTPAGGIVSGIIVLLALQYMTPLLFYIPEAALAVVIIMAVLDPITFHKVWIIWKTKKIDLLPWFGTFIISFVFNIEFGLIVGAVVSLLILMYPLVRPKVTIHEPEMTDEGEASRVIVVTLSGGLMYPGVEHFQEKVSKICTTENAGKCVVLDFSHVANIDTSTIQAIRELLHDFNKMKIQVFLCGLQKPVAEIFRRAQPLFFYTATSVSEAVETFATAPPVHNGLRKSNYSDSVPALLQYIGGISTIVDMTSSSQATYCMVTPSDQTSRAGHSTVVQMSPSGRE